MKKVALLGMMAGAVMGSDKDWWETDHDALVKEGVEIYMEAQSCDNPNTVTLKRIEDTILKSAKQSNNQKVIKDAIKMCPDSPLATRLSPLRRTPSPSSSKK